MSRLKELFDQLVEIGREHGQGVEFLLPPLAPGVVRRILTERLGAAPDWLCEWFSWHNGSDLSVEYTPSAHRPERWAFGSEYLTSVETCGDRNSGDKYVADYERPPRPVVLVKARQVESVAVDLELESFCFLYSARYVAILAPSFTDYLELWLRIALVSEPAVLIPTPVYRHSSVGDDPQRNMCAADLLPQWNHAGSVYLPWYVIGVALPGPWEMSEDPLDDPRQINFDQLRHNFAVAFAAPAP
jgi:hypothetical protein